MSYLIHNKLLQYNSFLKYKLHFVSILCLVFLFTSPSQAQKQKLKKNPHSENITERIVSDAIKSSHILKTRSDTYAYLASFAQDKKEAQKFRVLFDSLYGTSQNLKPINIVGNKIFVDGKASSLSFNINISKKTLSLLQNNKNVSLDYSKKLRPIHLLLALEKVSLDSSQSRSLWSFFVNTAYANNEGNSGIGLVLYHILQGLKKETVDCSEIESKVDYLNREYSTVKKTQAKWPLNFEFSSHRDPNQPSKNNSQPQQVSKVSEIWLDELVKSDSPKKIRCDYSSYPNISASLDDEVKVETFSDGRINVKFSAALNKWQQAKNFVGLQGNTTHSYKGNKTHSPSVYLVHDGRASFCAADTTNAILHDMGFAISEICKLALSPNPPKNIAALELKNIPSKTRMATILEQEKETATKDSAGPSFEILKPKPTTATAIE